MYIVYAVYYVCDWLCTFNFISSQWFGFHPFALLIAMKSNLKGGEQKEKANKFVGFNDSNEMIVQFGT